MGFRAKIKRLVQRIEDRAVEVARDLSPEVEADSWLDLKGEELEGRRERGGAPAVPITPETARKPVYRKDGQVHNFGALPVPGNKHRPLTRAQYAARYGGARPVPGGSLNDFNKGGGS